VIQTSETQTGVWFEDDDDLATLVGTAILPDGGTLRLMRRGEHFAIMYGREQLMSSWDSGSEESLARIVCERLTLDNPRLLIGGLGMGFTLSAALGAVATEATILVAELVPEVLVWATGPLAHIFGDSLDDARVTLEICDVHDVIVRHSEEFDGILLDVDNGPDGLLDLANDRLYCNWGLRAAYEALRPGGILGIWSAYRDDDFLDRLEDAGFDVEEIVITASIYPKAQCHLIWLAHKSPGALDARAA
jgi:spermidine synthase